MIGLMLNLPDELYKVFFGEWLYLKDVCKLDTAMFQKFERKAFLANLKGSYSQIKYINIRNAKSNLIIKWVIRKELRFTNLLIDRWNKSSFTEDELAYLYKPETNSNLQTLIFQEAFLNFHTFKIDLFSKFAKTLINLKNLSITWIDIDSLDDLVQLILKYSLKLKLISFQYCKISSIILESIAEQCSSLEKLDIIDPDFECYNKNYKKEHINGFLKISMNCQNIYAINLSGNYNLADTVVNFIINNLLNLKYIKLDECYNLKDCFSTITRETLKLTYIRVDSTNITDEGICSITSKCPQLKIFYALNFTFTIKMAKSIGDNCSTLEELYCDSLTDISFSLFATHCLNLTIIDISCSCVGNDSFLAIIHNCIELRHIFMILCSNLTDDCFLNINNYELKLITISLKCCSEITERGILSMIEKCPDLKQFETNIESLNYAQFKKSYHNCYKKKL